MATGDFAELVCAGCVAKLPFLLSVSSVADGERCCLAANSKGADTDGSRIRPLFLSSGWRDKLCVCDKCKVGVLFSPLMYVCT